MAVETGGAIMRASRILLLRLLSIAIGLAIPLIALEVVLRILPTSSVALRLPVDAEHPVARFPADMTYRSSSGWALRNPVYGRTNNAGYVSDVDYDPVATTPLLAVVGDSFVEAMMVPYAQSLQGRLAAAVGAKGRVYGFGMSGAPLSQYLIWAEHAARTYRPQGLLIPIIANDFDESILAFKTAKGGMLYGGYHYFVEKGGKLELELVPYTPSRVMPLLEASALARYLVFHLKVHKLSLSGLFGRNAVGATADRPESVSAEAAALRAIFEPAFFETWPEKEALSRRAADAFLDELPRRTGLAPDRILLLVDANRTAIIEPRLAAEAKASFFGRMRAYLMAGARARGYEVIDLDGPFAEHRARTGESLEFSHDYHWNGTGYAVAADAVIGSRLFERLFGPSVTGEAATSG